MGGIPSVIDLNTNLKFKNLNAAFLFVCVWVCVHVGVWGGDGGVYSFDNFASNECNCFIFWKSKSKNGFRLIKMAIFDLLFNQLFKKMQKIFIVHTKYNRNLVLVDKDAH